VLYFLVQYTQTDIYRTRNRLNMYKKEGHKILYNVDIMSVISQFQDK